MMKKYISFLCVCIILMTLAGCGKNTYENTNPSDNGSVVNNGTSEENNANGRNETADSSIPFAESDFADAAKGFFGEKSTELINCVMAVYPVEDSKVILQFKYFDATDDQEIPVEATYSYTFTVADKTTLKHTESDQNGDTVNIIVQLSDNGEATVSSDSVALKDIVGNYFPMDGGADVDPRTILEYLRNISAANIGDFGLNNPYDELEEGIHGDWFHELTLIRENQIVEKFLIADDFSAVLRKNGENYSLIYGSMENTVNHVDVFEYYNEEEDIFEEYTMELVYAYVAYGNEMVEGNVTEVCVEAPYDLVDSLTVVTSDESVVEVSENHLTAKNPGEAVITVTFVYGGLSKNCEIPISVVKYDPEVEYLYYEYVDEKYSVYLDRVSMRATLDICFEDDIYGVDILWADGGDTTHHWSYIGTSDEKGNLTLNGSYSIERYEDGEMTEEVVFDNEGATLTLGEDGCYYWHDEYDDAGKNCVFEPVA